MLFKYDLTNIMPPFTFKLVKKNQTLDDNLDNLTNPAQTSTQRSAP
jgi:hypothetical protein